MLILYQPIVDLRSRHVLKAEALCRLGTPNNWQRPDDFVPYAERNGLIRDLTDRVLERALTDWKLLGTSAPAGLSLNLSLSNLVEVDLPARVSAALKRHQTEPSVLWFEISENAQTIDDAAQLQTMEKLAALGVRFSVDSFGLGLSPTSLSELRRLPVSELKIDQRFVRDMDTEPAHRARVSSVIELARQMRLDVVAKGVERDETARLLERMGCPLGQGYLFGEPVDAPSLARFVEDKLDESRSFFQGTRIT